MIPSNSSYGDIAPTLSDAVTSTVAQAGPALGRLASQAEDMARRGVESVRHQTQLASDSTRGYIRDEPVKSVLIAAAVGAGLMALVTLAGRAGSRG